MESNFSNQDTENFNGYVSEETTAEYKQEVEYPEQEENLNTQDKNIDFPQPEEDKNGESDGLYQPEEDNHVLTGIKLLQTCNLFVTVIAVIILILLAIAKEGIILLICIIPTLGHYFVVSIILSWCRGIYRHLMKLSSSQNSPPQK